MEPGSVERKLVAILASDIVGYSRLMGADDVGTLARLKAYRKDVIDPKIAEHHGRIVKTTGDGMLVEFASIVDAVQCATDIQGELAAKNADLPNDLKMEFRIGVNIGDVIVEGDDIYGDGVNVAARLEALAAPGGICIAGSVYEQVKKNLDVGYEFLGKQEVKNIAEPVSVFRVRIEPGAAAPPGATSEAVPGAPTSPAPPEKPSIVVLPFENMSGDPEQAYFSDGIVEDIITDLSHVSGLFVVARNSAFTYKGKIVKVQEVSRELGVRYVLEGSVRKAGNRVRINAQLIDGGTGGHIWAERYDRDLTDIFAVQDEVTRNIVSALAIELTRDEQGCLGRKGTDNLVAYDYFLRGREYAWRHTSETNAQARSMFARAIELDRKFAAAYAGLAYSHVLDYVNRWSESPRQSLEQAQEQTQTALGLNDSEPHARFVSSVVDGLRKAGLKE